MMRLGRRVGALGVGLALVVGAPGPARAAAPSAVGEAGAAGEEPESEDEASVGAAVSPEPARASLAVDTAGVGPSSPVLLRRIEELGDIELRRAEILPGRSTTDPVINIRVRALEEGGYAIDSHLVDASGVVERSERTVLCNLCTEGETVERARVEVERLIPFVRGLAEARARSAREAELPRAAPTRDGKGGLAPRTKAGIALAAVGAAGVGVGLGLALREPTPRAEMPLETVDTRAPGYVALGVGGALMVTGVILALRGRAPARRGRVQVAVGPRGLVLGGNF